ncbi:MAG: hypothetical protein E6J34_19135 [Chloroflexi bacterium]|nr:MAG: hypothetical protein E6J34_19135 [Chloroflexota bacterium]
MSSLQTLRLDRNQLREVPGGLWLLIGLQVLSLEEQGSLVVQEVKHIILHADRHMVWILELPRYVDTFWSIVERATRKCVHINDA